MGEDSQKFSGSLARWFWLMTSTQKNKLHMSDNLAC